MVVPVPRCALCPGFAGVRRLVFPLRSLDLKDAGFEILLNMHPISSLF